jgi:hypothetical protein
MASNHMGYRCYLAYRPETSFQNATEGELDV